MDAGSSPATAAIINSLNITIMDKKSEWQEFAEVTGFNQTWKEIGLGAAIGVGVLVVAAVAEKIGDWLQAIV